MLLDEPNDGPEAHVVFLTLPEKDETTIRNELRTLVHDLLLTGKIEAGTFAPVGPDQWEWRALHESPDEVLSRIEADWPAERRPDIGEGLWFTSPAATHPR